MMLDLGVIPQYLNEFGDKWPEHTLVKFMALYEIFLSFHIMKETLF